MSCTKKIEFRELRVADAAAVASIESSTHDESLTYGEDVIAAGLSNCIGEGLELSLGMFNAGELVGYILCFGCRPSNFAEYEDDAVVYIDDIAVLPEYRRMVFRLVSIWYASVRKTIPTLAVEAHVLETGCLLWRKHSKLLTGIGLDYQSCEDDDQVIAGHRRYRIRWNQVSISSGAADYKHHLNSLPGVSYHIDGEEYSVRLLQRESDWLIYESVWDSLVKQSPDHNLFQSYDFLRQWWRHFGQDKELYILFVCKRGEIIGFASFNILKRKIRGLTFNEIGFIGSPFEVDRPSIVMAQDEAAGIKAVVRYLSDNRQDWDLVQIFEQEKGEALDVMRQAFRDSNLLLASKDSSLCYYLDCTEPWDEFITNKPRKFRRNLRAAQRKLESQGDLQYHVYRQWPEIENQLAVYRDIERRSRKEAEGIGIANTPQHLAFYYSLAETFGKKHLFCMRVLTLDEKPIVATFGIYFNDVFYSLQITHDMAYNKASPGTYLEAVELEECYAEESCGVYDFLGSFVNNKSRWSSTKRLTDSLHVYQRSPILTLVYVTHFIIEPRVRPLLSWVKTRLKKST